MDLHRLRVTEVGEFVHYRGCERRFKLAQDNASLVRQLPFVGRLFNPLDPVLEDMGSKRENEWEESLKSAGLTQLSSSTEKVGKKNTIEWSEFCDLISDLKPGESAYAREVVVNGQVGSFWLEGHIDFVLLLWSNGVAKLRLVECKASRRDKTYHRVQLCLYKILVDQLTGGDQKLQVGGLEIECVEGVVARIDPDRNATQAILDIEPFDLRLIESDVLYLLSEEGPLQDLVDRQLEELDYQLESKCDDCRFNIHCFPESGRGRKLQLLGCDPGTVRAFHQEGVQTIDDLARLDLRGEAAQRVSRSPLFNDNLERLRDKARARLTMLPGKAEGYPVQYLSGAQQSQLPEYQIGEHRLIRIYLEVDYDYTENRVGCLSAHVTTSDYRLSPDWMKTDRGWSPAPTVSESFKDKDRRERRPLRGIDVIRFKEKPWTGNYDEDCQSECELIQTFFQELVKAIRNSVEAERAPIHFYVWTKNEIRHLTEACVRSSSSLVSHLRELLGCREALEQMIYSCVQDEVANRFALGWSGRGLAVVSSLRWFGETYHWKRLVNGSPVNLDSVFRQDIFDFVDRLRIADGRWLPDDTDGGVRTDFEVRSKFNDSLPAAYWRAVWGTLPDKPNAHPLKKRAIDRYKAASKEHLREYLRARVHALRWVEERVRYKNRFIEKPLVELAELPEFTLGVLDASRAALDVLRLDHHVLRTDWTASMLVPPKRRITSGRTIPISNTQLSGRNELIGSIDVSGYDLTVDDLQARCSFSEGSFVRVSPCFSDPAQPQTLREIFSEGFSGTIQELNWENGRVRISIIPKRRSRYILSSFPPRETIEFASIDESPSDFVAERVDDRLGAGVGSSVMEWFDRTSPSIPAVESLEDDDLSEIEELVKTFKLQDDYWLAEDQWRTIVDGLKTTVQLVQGPPGTGKTMTTAVAVLTRILARCANGDVVLLSANTHTAIDTLLARISSVVERFGSHAESIGRNLPALELVKVTSGTIPPENPIDGVSYWPAASLPQRMASAKAGKVIVLGGTTSGLLKAATSMDRRSECLEGNLLVVDEASMMVFPHFLSLASLVTESGSFLLAGDHRQLSPILAHDWEREDRPPAVLYQPYASSYDSVRALEGEVSREQLICSALQYTFRLPEVVRRLIAPLYLFDSVELNGPGAGENCVESLSGYGEEKSSAENERFENIKAQKDLSAVWEGEKGLYLVVHDERESRQSNQTECEIVAQLLEQAQDLSPQ